MSNKDNLPAPVVNGDAHYDFILQGTLEAVEPIHVTSADKVAQDKAGVVFVPRMIGGQQVRRAAIKGETIKGALRRRAVEVADDVLRGRQNHAASPFALEAYYRNAIGGVKGRGSQQPDDVFLVLDTCARNPIAAIFGNADPFWIPGAVGFGFATTQQDNAWGTIAGGARRDPLLDPNTLSQFSESDQAKWLSYAETNRDTSKSKGEGKVLKREMAKILKKKSDGTAAASDLMRLDELRGEIAEIESGVATRKNQEIVTETINRPLDSKNAILPGAVMDHKMDGMRLSATQLGFMFKVLERMSDDPRLGGHKARGFGGFKARWNLKVRVTENGRRGPYQDAGTVVLDQNEFTLPSHPVVDAALAAFAAMERDPKVDFLFAERRRGGAAEPAE